MNIHEANTAFYTSYMHQGMLTNCDDFGIWWMVWCAGSEL